jgi:hypothetical protein
LTEDNHVIQDDNENEFHILIVKFNLCCVIISTKVAAALTMGVEAS